MTLVDELKAIRDRKPSDVVPMEAIPCRETSDTERLCPHPVVSVIMVTYNHEPYIREAIESVLMQKTDFEVELIIGEDCSQDRTREICFDYQRRYPEKIRVLWSDENVYKIDGNERRCIYKARGDYLAFCEGDDYWTDPLKLQKQVDLIRAKDAVMCVAFNEWLYNDGTKTPVVYDNKPLLSVDDFKRHYFHTSTYLTRRVVHLEMLRRYDRGGGMPDVKVELCMASMGRVCLLPEIVSVYRRNGEGVASSLSYFDRALFAAPMFFDLYTWGPVCSRAYAVRQALSWLEEPICVNRRYRPVGVTWNHVRQLMWARQFVLDVCCPYDARSGREEVRYYLNVLLMVMRMLFVRMGLGKLMPVQDEKM